VGDAAVLDSTGKDKLPEPASLLLESVSSALINRFFQLFIIDTVLNIKSEDT
jgi:hypothetical protein